ncbi:MAG: hypothetical protein NVS4B11_28950 [Ktedonobacteraceae bacterium]
MKYLKIGIYELYALAIIAFAIGLRVVLLAMGWPPTDSDEGTMGIMARHIAYRGEHPYVFYGQNYMGTIEAHMGAVFFHLFGSSLFSLRLSVIIFVTLFLISTYLLASQLYTKKVALVTLAVLSLGSIYTITRETLATGGSTQTLFFGSLAFLFATWFSFTYSRGASLRVKLLRFVGYIFWGVVLGLGFWSDMIVLPFFACAVLLMVIFCWRDLLWTWIGVLGGFIVGAYPVLSYSLKAASSGQDVLTTLFGLFHGSTVQAPHGIHQIIHAVKGTVLISVPTATGYPFCPVMEQSFLSDNTVQTPLCTLGHALWGVGYIALLILSVLLTLGMLWGVWRQGRFTMRIVDTRQNIVRYVSQLLLLGSAALAITAYAFSSAPVGWPGYHSRYLIGLLIVTPVLIAPLWNAASKAYTMQFSKAWLNRLRTNGSRAVLVLIALVYIVGTGILFSEVPATQAANQRQVDLINHLVTTGHTHIYTEYWECNKIAFESNERVICGVLYPDLQPSHNRTPGYWDIVHADPQADYVFSIGSPQVALLDKRMATSKQKYERSTMDGYVVWQPVS